MKYIKWLEPSGHACTGPAIQCCAPAFIIIGFEMWLDAANKKQFENEEDALDQFCVINHAIVEEIA